MESHIGKAGGREREGSGRELKIKIPCAEHTGQAAAEYEDSGKE